jgi:hypothetical protein
MSEAESLIKIAACDVEALLPERLTCLLANCRFDVHVLSEGVVHVGPFSPHISSLNFVNHAVSHIALSVRVQPG